MYPEELSPQGLVQATKMNSPLIYRSTITGEEIEVPMNMRRLNAILNNVDYAQVRARRRTYNRLIHEARIVQEEHGISFTNMLLLLAHYKLINDSEALRCVIFVNLDITLRLTMVYIGWRSPIVERLPPTTLRTWSTSTVYVLS